MARYRAWLIALYIPDQVEWIVCRSVEREWLSYRRQLLSTGRESALSLVRAMPFATVREAEEARSFVLSLSPRARFNVISAANPEWENLMDQPDMLVLFQQFVGDDEEGGGAAARVLRAPRDPILTSRGADAKEWPEAEDGSLSPHAWRTLLAEGIPSEAFYGANDPEERLLSRLNRA